METQVTNETQTPDSVRESLTAAIETLGGSDTPVTAAPKTEHIGAAAAPAVDEKPLGIGADKLVEKIAPVAAEGVQKGLTDTPARTQVRAPASWKPEIREKWNALPAEVQGEVMRREREVQQVLEESVATRRFAEAFRSIAEPFSHIIAMEGKDALSVFSDYLKTATILRSGSPQERAAAIAQAVQFYGIDVQALDGALAAQFQGKPMPQGQQQGAQQYQDPRVDQLFQYLTQQSQQQEQALEQDVGDEITAFSQDPKNEFFDDLRGDISDILRLSAARGVKMSLSDAYNRAAKLHPEISKIVTQREAAAGVKKESAFIAQKRAAASSLKVGAPRQTGTEFGASTGSLRADIEAAIAQNAG